jgi:hypothetical protein
MGMIQFTPQPSRNSLVEGVLVDRNAGLEMLLLIDKYKESRQGVFW